MFKFKDLQSTMSFYGHCSFTYLWNMHHIQLHDSIHNATRATEYAERAQPHCFAYRLPVRPIVPICPSICRMGWSIKNGRWRLCNFCCHCTTLIVMAAVSSLLSLVVLLIMLCEIACCTCNVLLFGQIKKERRKEFSPYSKPIPPVLAA